MWMSSALLPGNSSGWGPVATSGFIELCNILTSTFCYFHMWMWLHRICIMTGCCVPRIESSTSEYFELRGLLETRKNATSQWEFFEFVIVIRVFNWLNYFRQYYSSDMTQKYNPRAIWLDRTFFCQPQSRLKSTIFAPGLFFFLQVFTKTPFILTRQERNREFRALTSILLSMLILIRCYIADCLHGLRWSLLQVCEQFMSTLVKDRWSKGLKAILLFRYWACYNRQSSR